MGEGGERGVGGGWVGVSIAGGKEKSGG